MKIYAINLCRNRLDGRIHTYTVTQVEANDERQALCGYLMNHPEMEDAVLARPNGKWQLCRIGNAYREYFVAEEASSAHEITEEMKEEIFFRTT